MTVNQTLLLNPLAMFTRTLCTATLIGTGIAILAPASLAHHPRAEAEPLAPTHIVYNLPQPPDQGAPDGRQRGGASRGPCQAFETLTALVPTTADTVWALTTAQHPTFLFYLPPALDEHTVVEFTLQDASDDYVYHTQLAAPTTSPELVQVTVPDTATALQVGQSYSWTLAVYCDPSQPARSVFVTGTVQRTQLDEGVEAAIAQADPLQQARWYASQGIWHEALAVLAHQVRTHPTNPEARQAWETLLAETALQDVAPVPVVVTPLEE